MMPLQDTRAADAQSAVRATVFFSYSRKDLAFADRLDAALTTMGFDVLIDRTEIYAFEDWWTRIQSLIVDADTILFVVSPDSVGSDVCAKEVGFAASLNKRLAPIVVRRVDPAAIPLELSRRNFVFFDDDTRFDESVSTLADALDTDIDWVRTHTELTRTATAWAAACRPRGLLLRSPRLEEAERWFGSRPPAAPVAPDVVQEFIGASRRHATKLLRWGIAVSLAVTALASSLAIFAWVQRTDAVNQKAIVADRFARLSVANGERLLAQGDVSAALLWFANPLLASSDDQDVHRIRIASTAGMYPRLRQLIPHDQSIETISLDTAAERVLTVSADSSVRVFDIRGGSVLFPAFRPSSKPGAVALAGDGKTFATVSPKPHDETDLRNLFARLGRPVDDQLLANPDFKMLADVTDPLSLIRSFDAATGASLTSVVVSAGEAPKLWPIGESAFLVSGSVSIPEGPSGGNTVIWRPGQSPAISKVGDVAFDDIALSRDGTLILGGEYPAIWRVFTNTGETVSSGRHDVVEQGLSSVALSPDGQRFATADQRGRVRLWEARTGKPSGKPLEQGNSEVAAMAFSPDGRWLATVTGSNDAAVHLWDSVTGQLIFKQALAGPGFSISFSPSGRYLLSTWRQSQTLEGNAQVWDVGNGLAVGPPLNAASFAAWTLDGRSIVTAGADQAVRVWDLFRTGPTLSLGQQEMLRNGRMSDTGSMVLARDGEKLQGLEVAAFDRLNASVPALAPPGDRPFALSDDGSIWVDVGEYSSTVFDGALRQALPEFEYKTSNGSIDMIHVSDAKVSGDRAMVLIAGGDGSANIGNGYVLVWDARTGRSRAGPFTHDDFVNAASFSPDARLVASASRDKTARIWSINSGAELHRLQHDAAVNAIAFAPDGRVVATASDDGVASMWNVDTGALRGQAIRHENAVRFVTFSPDGSLLLTAALSGDGQRNIMRLWDASTGLAKGAAISLGSGVLGKPTAAFSRDGRFIVASDGGGGFRVWNVATSEAVTPHVDGGDESARRVNARFLARARSLLISHDRNGVPVLIGIGNRSTAGHQVAQWSMPHDDRAPADMLVEFELMAGRRIDATGSLVRLTTKQIEDRWRQLKTTVTADVSRDTLLSWHRREAQECEATVEWFCVAWHIERIELLQPSFMNASFHRTRGRALAELERWSEAEAEYASARALGADDGETLASLARLRFVRGQSGNDRELTEWLLDKARAASELDERSALLRAILLGPTTDAERAEIIDVEQSQLRSDNDKGVREVLVAAFYRSNRLIEARAQLEELERDRNLNQATLVLAAMVEWRLNDRTAAAGMWRRFQEQRTLLRGSRRYYNVTYGPIVHWHEWLELSAFAAEASRLMSLPD
jgi:WD40 repeat protein